MTQHSKKFRRFSPFLGRLFTTRSWHAWTDSKRVLQRRRAIGLGFVALALACGLGMSAMDPAPPARPLAPVQAVSTATDLRVARLEDGAADAPLPVDLHKFALNAFLAPLLDDAVPPRWTDVALDFMCDSGTSITVGGEPMSPGSLVPPAAFHLRWDMGHCEPLGPAMTFSGVVELVVFHEDAGFSAIVVPDRLQLNSPGGRSQLREMFTAEMSLATSHIVP